MPGRDNWHGSGFHADVVTARVLQDLIAQREAERAGAVAPPPPDYWIENSADGAGPDWDVMERRGSLRILEELKSGNVSAEERRAIWVRVRRTVSAGTPVQNVVARLTADRDTIKLKQAWAGLAGCTPIPKRAPTEPPSKVNTSERLFQEALAYLTHKDLQFAGSNKRKKARGRLPDIGAPLSFADAVALLRRFEFVADRSRADVQNEITKALQSLKSKTSATVLQTWLLGHFFAVAQEGGAIQATRLANALPLVQSILHLDPDLDRLLDRVFNARPTKPPPKKLALHDWRTVQPATAAAIDAAAASSSGAFLVLTGEAGIGKSTVLAGVFDELKAHAHDVAWLALGYDGGPPPTPPQLDRLTELLAQRCAWQGKACWLLVDGIDGLPDRIHYLAPRGSLRVVVAARTETYEPTRKLQATQVQLTRWPTTEVEHILGTPLPLDLSALLGNPFLLNLAMETPPESSKRLTRFAVLSRYLADVVFVRGVRGVDARRSFDVMASGLARGQVRITPPTAGLKVLIDQGVVTAPCGGRVQFAHPLFGEFSIAMHSSRRDAEHTTRRLSRIRDSFTQGAALRILLEGCVDTSDSSHLLDVPTITAMIDASLGTDIDIIGALASLDVGVPEVLQHKRAREFCARLFRAASLIDQRSWLRALPLLDLSPAPPWATAMSRTDALPLIADHLAACADEFLQDTGREVALRLREWSRGQKSIWVSYLVRAIGRFLADNDTLRWMASLTTTDASGYSAWLRSGLRLVCSRGTDLDQTLVGDVISRVIRTGQNNLEEFEDAYNLFLADKGERGLLETQPELAIELLFDWQDRETDDDRRRRQRRREGFPQIEPMEPTIEDDDDE